QSKPRLNRHLSTCACRAPEYAVAVASGQSPHEARDRSAPANLSERVEVLRIARVQHRLGSAIAALLAVVGLYGIAAEVPHERGRRIAEPEPRLDHSPANVNVIARSGKPRIESANFDQRGLGEDHVAAGEVLGFVVVLQNVARSPGSGGHASGDSRWFRWSVVRTAATVEAAITHGPGYQG